MTSFALNNLWTYIEGLSLKRKDREWLANKLLEPVADDKKTARQKAYVKETLTRAFDEVKAARRGETKMMTEEEFLEGLKAELPAKWEYYIERLSSYIASSGKKYQNHAATIRRWAEDDRQKTPGKREYSYKEGESL